MPKKILNLFTFNLDWPCCELVFSADLYIFALTHSMCVLEVFQDLALPPVKLTLFHELLFQA